MEEEIEGKKDIKNMAVEIVCDRFSEEGWARTKSYVPTEMVLTVYVNSQALVTILCTAAKLDCLVLGYLYAEGMISGMKDIENIEIREDESTAEITLKDPAYQIPKLKTLGCSGNMVFKTQGQKVDSALVAEPEDVLLLMEKLQERMDLYKVSGGVHTSALSDTKELLVVAEDIGRHNTLNKIQGECLLRGISTGDRLLLITGRISSEMLLKAAKMGVPMVVSRHAPTWSAISLAREMGITLIGQARGRKLALFTCPERLGRQFG